jgi:hypothetical protein
MLETESPKAYQDTPFAPLIDPDLNQKLPYIQTFHAAVSLMSKRSCTVIYF